MDNEVPHGIRPSRDFIYLLFTTRAFLHYIRVIFFLAKPPIRDYEGESVIH